MKNKIICAPAVSIPDIYYIFRNDGTEVEISITGTHYNASHELNQDEVNYLKKMIDKKKGLRVFAKKIDYKPEKPKKGKLVINEQSGIFYESLKQACKYHGFAVSRIHHEITLRVKQKTYLRYA